MDYFAYINYLNEHYGSRAYIQFIQENWGYFGKKKRGSNITAYVATEDSFCMM